MIGKRFIPGNTNVQMAGYAMGRGLFLLAYHYKQNFILTTNIDEEQYTKAEEFIPERWSTRPELVKNKDNFHPSC